MYWLDKGDFSDSYLWIVCKWASSQLQLASPDLGDGLVVLK